MRILILIIAAFALLSVTEAQAQNVQKILLSSGQGEITRDTLDLADTTATTKYLPPLGAASLIFVTIQSTKPDTLRVWTRAKRPPPVYGGPIPDSTDQKTMVYQPERVGTADSLVILQPIIGSSWYQARFRIYEPIISDPFLFRVAVKKAAVLYITIKTKD